MGFLQNINIFRDKAIAVDVEVLETREDRILQAVAQGTGRYSIIGGVSYNGEKNLGEMGPIKGYSVDYATLRQRSWDLYLESEVALTIINRHCMWSIGKGLKLQAEPDQTVLAQKGIKMNKEEWTKLVEARFGLYKGSRLSDYSGMWTLNEIEYEAHKHAKVGGDVLVILRYEEGAVKVQLIDGAHVVSPRFGTDRSPEKLKNGNKIIHGVEINSKGMHVAYHVRKPGILFETDRIPARGPKSGLIMAYLVYGNRYRIDSHRGMPLLSVVMETTKKLERYKEAAVGSAEERQKVAYMIEHQAFSSGENPILNQTVRAWDTNMEGVLDYPTDDLGNALADKIAATTNKQTYNLPLGATMKELTSKNELYFKEFFDTNIAGVCSACNIPYDVAMSIYNNSYSASRAALKDWDNSLIIDRYKFSSQFHDPIYEMFLETEALTGGIEAKAYLKARAENDLMTIEAYRKKRFIGAPVPHIDPEKEVAAERLKLGEAGAAIPLTTVEQATESLSSGDSQSNIEQFSEELKKAESLGIKIEPPAPAVGGGNPAPAKKKK